MHLLKLKPTQWPIAALILSAAMLAAAHAFEHFGRYLPCPLCLRQREVYWAAITVATGGLIALRLWSSDRLIITINMLLCLVFVTSFIIAGYHAGVEWHMWPGPTDCSVNVGGGKPLDFSNMDLDQKFSTVSCTEAAWRMFGMSMAGYNMLISLVLAVISAGFAALAFKAAPRPVDLD